MYGPSISYRRAPLDSTSSVLPWHRVIQRLLPEKPAELLIGAIICHVDGKQVVFKSEIIFDIPIVPDKALLEEVLIVELLFRPALPDFCVVDSPVLTRTDDSLAPPRWGPRRFRLTASGSKCVETTIHPAHRFQFLVPEFFFDRFAWTEYSLGTSTPRNSPRFSHLCGSSSRPTCRASGACR